MKQTHLIPLLLLAFTCLFSSCDKEDEQPTYSCVDYIGKEYKTVVIGNQVWMAQNLATKYLSDGGEITNSKDVLTYPSRGTIPQYSYFQENTIYKDYGLLYNYLCAIDEKLAPEGWRIPTREDWEKLENYVKTHPSYDSINWVGKALASSTDWSSSNVLGAIGDHRTTNNKFGFNVIPAGYRTEYGAYYADLKKSMFWTSTVDSVTTQLQVVAFSYDAVGIQWETLDKVHCGCYIRCVRDL